MRLATAGRPLRVEPLEDRRMLAAGGLDPAAPWRNAHLPLDVTNDGVVRPIDAAQIVNQLLKTGIRPLRPPDPANPPQNYYDANGDNMLSAVDLAKVVNALLSPPAVTIDTLMPFTIDLTPQVTITAAAKTPLADGTPVMVDVDLNGDGNFNGPNEINQSSSNLFRSGARFDLAAGIQPNDPQIGPYTVYLRAHLQDANGVEGFSPVEPLLVDTRTSDALLNYVNTADGAFQYSLARTNSGAGYTSYVIDLKSQQWRTAADVSKPIWQHWVQIIVPAGAVADTALIYVHGGSTNANPPSSTDSTLVSYALQTHSVIVDLPNVPNQPLFFSDEPTNSQTEDEIIAYSYDQYMRHIGEPGNDTWPVLQAMVKSVVRTMDTVQAYVPTVKAGAEIDHFVITGYSKRGWTTWLTPAVDSRVSAIIPGVFEMLNQGPELVHHYGSLTHFSEEIQDYTNRDIFSRILTNEGILLGQIVDPYHYLDNPNYDIPKLMIVASGDQFFVSDSAQYYFHDLPGDQNYVRYIPNTGHPLDVNAIYSTLTFYDAVLNHRELPKFSWTIDYDQTIRVHTETAPTQVLLWQATNPDARDFRQYYVPDSVLWTSTVLTDQGGGIYLGNTPIPPDGATGYFIELTYPSAIPGVPYVFTTEIRINTDMPLVPWPYPGIDEAPPLAPAVVSEDLNAAASALTSPAATPSAIVAGAGSSPPEADIDEAEMLVIAAVTLSADDESPAQLVDAESAAVDFVFADDLVALI